MVESTSERETSDTVALPAPAADSAQAVRPAQAAGPPPATRPEPDWRTQDTGFELTGESTPILTLLRQLVASRGLLVMLSRQSFYVRYRRASFGLAWSVALPLFQAIVMAVVFSHILRVHAGVNYPTFVYSGLVPWLFFSGSLPTAATSIVEGQDMATKVYFPRAILPLVTIGSGFYGFLPSVAILVGFALVEHVSFGLNWLLLLPATLLMVVLTGAFALVLAAAQVYFRDVRYLVMAALTAWLYLAPVLYPLNQAPAILRRFIQVLPTTGMVDFFRAGSVGAGPGWAISLAYTGGWAVALLAVAAVLYRRFDRVFVDLM